MASSASVGFGKNEYLEPPIKKNKPSDDKNLKSEKSFETSQGSSDVPSISQDDTGM